MTKNPSDQKKLARYLARSKAREDRIRARRVARIKRALAGSILDDGEIWNLEQIVFLAYGRTKL